MKETTASAKPLARPIGWRSVPALTAELQSRGPLLGPPPDDVRRSAQSRWRWAFVRGTSLPGDRSAVHILSIRLAVPSEGECAQCSGEIPPSRRMLVE